ncbi:MAG: M6 family metalloprotease domain-containing protein, partial [candidate division Zixibacteria bacterium]|nr:M6 family metalloprotease domain-containing protein [candidate division Zixibacteria bacterium]
MKDMQRLMTMEKSRLGVLLIILLIGFVILTSPVSAVAPHPDAIEKWKAEGVLEQKLANLRAFKEAGGCSAEEHTPISLDRFGRPLALASDQTFQASIIVILVDFSDNEMSAGVSTTPAQFDSVLFSNDYHNPTGSMVDYYKENSYGDFVVRGDILGPYRMTLPYAYYVGNDDGLSRGPELTADALDSARLHVANWNQYDINNDDICDGLVIIHAGAGAEAGAVGIWSHKSNIPAVYIDGVQISAYTMNPEETGNEISPIGVFCHEYGHFLGLPDLYDISDAVGSNGLGDWALMATGSYNAGSRQPAHLTAWSKAEIGFLSLLEVNSNMSQVEFPHVEENRVAYRLQNSLSTAYEYWIVENRQQVGFDVGLPSSGLCIYHVDKQAPGPSNQNPEWYRVAMEQADGENALAFGGSRGDGGDVWPGSSDSREFHDQSVPNSRTNLLGTLSNGVTTRIGLWNISNSGMTMTADLDEDWSHPWPLLVDHDSVFFDDAQPGGDGDGILDPGETISFYVTMTNAMRLSYNATIRLETNHPSVTFNTDEVLLSPQFDDSDQSNLTPITFTLAETFVP